MKAVVKPNIPQVCS